jgi:hypothetical protein
VIEVAEQMIERVEGLGDIRTAAAGDAKELTELLISVLANTDEDPAVRVRALDALDRLVAAGAWGVIDVVDTVGR